MARKWLTLWSGALFALGGCASGNHVLLDTLLGILSGQAPGAAHDVLATKPNPNYHYLLVSANGSSPALLVLGYVDGAPVQSTDVWYSAKSEVLKLQGGRIVGSFGLPTDWRSVRYPDGLPAWQAGAYPRIRDLQPGYRYGVHDSLQLQPLPASPLGARVLGMSAAQMDSLVWFEEKALGDAAAQESPAWYALQGGPGQQRVVYSRQCLAPGYCLELQAWPVAQAAP
jgi:hypothetical protein